LKMWSVEFCVLTAIENLYLEAQIRNSYTSSDELTSA
jgi:hypothetical protein